jgi:hypothetical protein
VLQCRTIRIELRLSRTNRSSTSSSRAMILAMVQAGEVAQADLMRLFGWSRQRTRYHMSRLERDGLVERVGRDTGRGRSICWRVVLTNVYPVRPALRPHQSKTLMGRRVKHQEPCVQLDRRYNRYQAWCHECHHYIRRGAGWSIFLFQDAEGKKHFAYRCVGKCLSPDHIRRRLSGTDGFNRFKAKRRHELAVPNPERSPHERPVPAMNRQRRPLACESAPGCARPSDRGEVPRSTTSLSSSPSGHRPNR